MGGRSQGSRKNPLLGAAVVKAVLLRQGGSTRSDLYAGLLRDLGLTDEEVDRYLQEHGDEVRAVLLSHGRRS